ncbi:amidohydrolase [Salinicoccus albus]|uniref:amidohydrolase n=1 Tax=Salinicoccus albus TaxID=418756 RepID=UPI000374952D|nr:amidohydrolase [Salinicoccus albus]
MKTLYYNGLIYTMESEGATTESVMEDKGIVTKTGAFETLEAEADIKVDLKGQTMLPALTDTHMHLVMLGKKLKSLALHHVDDLAEMKRLISGFRSAHKWNLILGYDENNLDGQYRMKRQELDALTDKPTLITRVCHHAGIVNTKALEHLNIDKGIEDPEGGYFERDSEGELTGWVYDTAFDQIRNQTVDDSVESVSSDIETAIEYLYKFGIAGAHTEDMSSYGPYEVPLKAYLETLGPDRLKFRVNLLRNEKVYDQMVEDDPVYIDDWVEKGAMKIFADGAFGGKTALVKAPYAGTDNHGLQIHSREDFEGLVKNARRNDDAVAVHMIGDAACELVLDTIEKYPAPKGCHDRLIHCSLLSESLIGRMAALPVICDIQPAFLTSDMPWIEAYLGSQRAAFLYPFKTMVDKGLVLGGSSDAPIEDVNPLLGVQTLVTRRGDTGVYNKNETVSRFEAFKMYTVNAAEIVHKEDVAGKIMPGYYADFAIFDRDVMRVEDNELNDAFVTQTVISGDTVYQIND